MKNEFSSGKMIFKPIEFERTGFILKRWNLYPTLTRRGLRITMLSNDRANHQDRVPMLRMKWPIVAIKSPKLAPATT